MKSPVSLRVGSIAALPLEEVQLDLFKYLDQTEIDAYLAFKIPKRQKEWLAGRIYVKQLYHRVMDLDVALPSIRIDRLPDGQPLLKLNGQPVGESISISHSHGWVAAAVDPLGQPIGIDLEQVELRDEAFLADYFTDNERNWIESSHELTREQKTTLIWSCKESVLKALGQGLHLDPLRLEIGEITTAISPGSFGSARGQLQLDDGDYQYILKWQLRDEMVFTFASLLERDLCFRHSS